MNCASCGVEFNPCHTGTEKYCAPCDARLAGQRETDRKRKMKRRAYDRQPHRREAERERNRKRRERERVNN